MSNVPSYSSGLAPPPRSRLWYCNGCKKQNPSARYVCQDCRYGDTYDLCGLCIGNANILHPGHQFSLESGNPGSQGCKTS